MKAVAFIIVTALSFLLVGSCFDDCQAQGWPYPVIRGNVVTPNGDPVVGITVLLYVSNQVDEYVGNGTTDQNGFYEIATGGAQCGRYVTAWVGQPSPRNTQKSRDRIQCGTNYTTIGPIVLACGGAHQPPCPQQ